MSTGSNMIIGEMSEWGLNLDDFSRKSEWSYNLPNSFMQTTDDKYGLLFYDYLEYAMGWVASDVVIFKKKQSPIVVVNSNGIKFRHTFKHDFVFAEQSHIAIFVRHCYDQSKNISTDTFCLFDCDNEMFSIITFNNCEFYTLIETEDGNLKTHLALPEDLDRYEKRMGTHNKHNPNMKIISSDLRWFASTELQNYDSIYCGSPETFKID